MLWQLKKTDTGDFNFTVFTCLWCFFVFFFKCNFDCLVVRLYI